MANPLYDPDLPDGPLNDPGPAATDAEAAREFARNVGFEDQGRCWILTNYDSWERNPFYSGPAVRHPEDDSED